MTNFGKVGHFMKTFGQEIKIKPDLSTEKINKLRVSLINEELEEFKDAIKNNEISLIINTPLGAQSRYDEYQIGRAAIRYKITVITTISGAQAAVRGIRNIKSGTIEYRSLQEVFC